VRECEWRGYLLCQQMEEQRDDIGSGGVSEFEHVLRLPAVGSGLFVLTFDAGLHIAYRRPKLYGLQHDIRMLLLNRTRRQAAHNRGRAVRGRQSKRGRSAKGVRELT
jgi:hypothetical protein